MRWHTLGKGSLFAFGTDGNYRLDQESWWLAGGYSNCMKYAYTEGNGLRLTSLTDQNAPSPTAVYSKIEFSYDDLGRLALLRDRIDPTTSPSSSESFDLNYTYNKVDQRTNAVSRFRQFNGSGVATAFQWDASMSYGWDSRIAVLCARCVEKTDAHTRFQHQYQYEIQPQRNLAGIRGI